LAERVRRESDRHDPTGMPRPHDRIWGGAPASDPWKVCRLLQWVANSSLTQQRPRFSRGIEHLGVITSRPILGGLHHQYCRI
jgi:hypothetical protein